MAKKNGQKKGANKPAAAKKKAAKPQGGKKAAAKPQGAKKEGSLAAIIDPYLMGGTMTTQEIAAELAKKAGDAGKNRDLAAVMPAAASAKLQSGSRSSSKTRGSSAAMRAAMGSRSSVTDRGSK